MPFIQWSEKMSVGNATIDQQHKTLIDMINTVYDAMGRGKGDNVLSETMKKLVQYTKSHFAHEEKYMQQMGYPEFEQHQRIHRELTKKVQDICQKISEGQYYSSVTLGGFLKDWLTSHIMNVDMKYVAFSKAGVS